MKVTCTIWWDKQDEAAQGWCVQWHTAGADRDDDATDTVDGSRRCGVTTLRRRAWRRVSPTSVIGKARRAFAGARWVWVPEDGGCWRASVEVRE